MKVITENSVYVFKDGCVTRHPAGRELRKDGEKLRVLEMDPPTVGEPMVMILRGVADSCRDPDRAIVTVRVTSIVLSIDRREDGEHAGPADTGAARGDAEGDGGPG